MAATCVDIDSTDILLHFAYVKTKKKNLSTCFIVFVHKIYEQFIPITLTWSFSFVPNILIFICSKL